MSLDSRSKPDSLYFTAASTLLTQTITIGALDLTIRLYEVCHHICRSVLQTFARVSRVSSFSLSACLPWRADRHLLCQCLSRPGFLSHPHPPIKESSTLDRHLGSTKRFSRGVSPIFHSSLTRSTDLRSLDCFTLVTTLIAALTPAVRQTPAAVPVYT